MGYQEYFIWELVVFKCKYAGLIEQTKPYQKNILVCHSFGILKFLLLTVPFHWLDKESHNDSQLVDSEQSEHCGTCS